jgi:hypothetical protein
VKRRTLLAATGATGAALATGTLLPGTARAATVAIDPASAWGAWEGWGTSLAWWANVMGERDDLADVFFTTDTVTVEGQDLPGLGFTIARYNLGACSWNAIDGQEMVVSPNMQAFKQIPGLWLDHANEDPESASWDWSADAVQRAALLKAVERGAAVELFSNSPMWWMLLNHNPAGAENAADNNLDPAYYRHFAVYLAEVASQAPSRWGLDFVSVEAFNEPTSDYWGADGRQEGCHFDTDVQQEIVALLREELDARGLSGMPIAVSDETSYDAARTAWAAYGAESRDRVARVNVHGYQGTEGRRDLLGPEVRDAGKALWNSEYGDSDASGLTMVHCLNLDLRWLRPDAWLFWQVLDEEPAWALIHFDPAAATLGDVQVKYWLLAQYSRHIRPGMQMIDPGIDGVVAALDESAGRLVIVAANWGDAAQEHTFDLSPFGTLPADGTTIRRWTTAAADGGERYAAHEDDVLTGGQFTRAVEPGTVHTFELDGVAA